MGFLSALFGSAGLSNSTTNMKNPIGYQRCLELCRIYDDWGGYKTPTHLLIGRPTGPGMELYEIFKAPDGRHLYRGVIFASIYKDDRPYIEPRVIEFFDLGDGGCPCLSVEGVFEHVDGDLYRTKTPFSSFIDGVEMETIAELNWNKSSNEFAYREVYTPVKG